MIRRVTVAAALLLVLAAGISQAADSPLKVATVDMALVSEKYTALQAKSQSLMEWQNAQYSRLVSLQDYMLLSADNFAEVAALLAAPQPLPDDKAKRLTELRNLANDKMKQFDDLHAKANRTAQEDEAYKSLSDLYATSKARLDEQLASLKTDYQQQVTQNRDGFYKKVVDVAAALAKSDGYLMVLDSSVVLVGGTDITDKVIAKLNEAK
ncbi:MAG TPA: OmpH family outer membrane protein [Armatimonadota bacterium]|jgi:Skp family chaperone for outer membrane proteins